MCFRVHENPILEHTTCHDTEKRGVVVSRQTTIVSHCANEGFNLIEIPDLFVM